MNTSIINHGQEPWKKHLINRVHCRIIRGAILNHSNVYKCQESVWWNMEEAKIDCFQLVMIEDLIGGKTVFT